MIFYKLAILITEYGCSFFFVSTDKSRDKFSEVKELLNNADGRERILIAISFLWLVLSNLLYFSGITEITETSNPPPIWPLPSWQVYWNYLTFNYEPFNYDFASLYTIREVRSEFFIRPNPGNILNGSIYVPPAWVKEYRQIGHFLLINIPIVIIWGLDSLCVWVISGFKDRQ